MTGTCHNAPWALIRRGGATPGKRCATRMAFLVGVIAPNGRALAVTGYLMRADMTGATKTPRRIEWDDILFRWRRKPTPAQVARHKQWLPAPVQVARQVARRRSTKDPTTP